MNDDKLKAADTALEALSLGAILQIPGVKLIAAMKHPISDEAKARVSQALANALGHAMEDGTVVRVACDTMSEIVYCGALLRALLKHMEAQGDGIPTLVENESTDTQFELSNNSAIMLNRKFSDDY